MYRERLVHPIVEEGRRKETVKVNVIEARLENAVEVEAARTVD